MARIANDEIDRLKQDVSVQRLIESRGVKLMRHGKDLIGLCPLHPDKDPSLVVTPSKNLWHCLGACQTGGTTIDWVMKAHGVPFRHAVELLRADLPSLPSSSSRPPKASTVRILPPPIERDADDREVLAQVVSFYHEQLKQSPEALGYLEKRGLRSAEMIERFQLGFANRTLGYRLPERNRKTGEELRGRLQRLGLLRDSGHEHFNGSLVVPVFDEGGQVVELYGRKIGERLRAGTPLHLYLPGPRHGVFNVEALKASKEIILCEALLDALTFWCHGFRNVTSSYGINGFTDDHLETLKRHGTETVLIAYDRDDAGEKAAATLAEKLVPFGIACYRVEFPHGLDANEYARKVDSPVSSLEILLRAASWLGGPTNTRARIFSSLVAASKEKSLPVTTAVASSKSPVLIRNLAKDPEVPEAKTEPATTPRAPIAAPVAVTPATLAIEAKEAELVVGIDDRTYRVRDLPATLTLDRLHANVLVTRAMETIPGSSLSEGFYVERFDLYARPQRAAFAKEAAFELRLQEDLIKRDLGQVLRAVEEHLEAKVKRAKETAPTPAAAMSDADREAALALLRAPDLLDRILQDFHRSGVVGEETNKLMGYLAVVSRKLEEPLAVIVQSSSAAGKSSLMDAVLAFVPEEDRIKYSAMTGQSLFYLGETNLKHKVLAIVEEEGAEKASYALKLLQSEGELTIASTGKDPETGKLVTQTYHVEGPVMIFLTTTASEVDEELLNRCLVLTVNEDRAQTAAIHELQRERETLEGQRARQTRARILELHRNAQRLVRPLRVVNPYARELTFLDDRTRTRRDHLKYLTLIRTTTLLHQHQREVKTDLHEGETTEYIEVTLDDIAIANRLAAEVLGRSLDELAPQTRRLLELLDALVRTRSGEKKMKRSGVRFSRRDVRSFTGWSADQLQVHLNRLVALEYVVAHHGGRGLSYEYELLYSGEAQHGAKPFLMGLIDVEVLRRTPTTERSAGSARGSVGDPRSSVGHLGPICGLSAAGGNGSSPHGDAMIAITSATDPEIAQGNEPHAVASYSHHR